MRVRGLLSTLMVIGTLSASGCCNLQKAPGRCVAGCYDGCIVPYASSLGRNGFSSQELGAASTDADLTGGAQAMAY